MYRLGVDIGGTKINIGIFGDNRALIKNKKVSVNETKNVSETILKVTKELADEIGITFEEIGFCGVGIPGTVSDDGRRILKAPNIGILNENTAEEIEKTLGVPVALVQDSRAAAWGEYLSGGGVGMKTVVCITLGTGIGCGIVLNGEILCGSLGSAGEIGHITAVPNGRKCGCGKLGCVEKYAAGYGLGITASEILGGEKTAADLFREAENGNKAAQNAVTEAVEMLGRTVVSVINLISPDCILFSGGLSAQEELYVKPIIKYVEEHCYSAGKVPILKKACLGENAPLYGAASLPFKPKRRAKLSASVMCADVLKLGDELKEIETAGIEYLHCDIMDNHFVPNLMLPPEMLGKFRQATTVPFDYHIMAENPESIIEKLDIRRGDIVSVHYESTKHLQKTIAFIKEKGALAAVAINPSTPAAVLEEILPQLDAVLVMTVNPGFAGQKLVPGAFEKIKRVRRFAESLGRGDIIIETDGNCSFENVPEMYRAGADIFVVGTSSVFAKGISVSEGTAKLKKLIDEVRI